MTREELLTALLRLPRSEFDVVVYRLKVPPEYLPGPSAPQSTLAVDLLRILERDERVNDLLALLASPKVAEPHREDTRTAVNPAPKTSPPPSATPVSSKPLPSSSSVPERSFARFMTSRFGVAIYLSVNVMFSFLAHGDLVFKLQLIVGAVYVFIVARRLSSVWFSAFLGASIPIVVRPPLGSIYQIGFLETLKDHGGLIAIGFFVGLVAYLVRPDSANTTK